MPRRTPALNLDARDQQQIQQWLAAQGTPQQVALRSRIVLAAGEGQSDSAIAERFEVNRKTVSLWRRRFAQQGAGSLWEIAPGRGRKPVYGADQIKALVDATLQTKPKGMTQWSCRLMAARTCSGYCCQRRVLPSMSVKMNVTVPEGALDMLLPNSDQWSVVSDQWWQADTDH